jgi:Na+/H+-translocating membrane pyrophosphatase
MGTGLMSAVIGLVGLAFALILFTFIKSKSAGTDLMKEISDVIHKGAMVSVEPHVPCWLVSSA